MNADDLLRGTSLHRDWTRELFRSGKWVVVLFAALTLVAELSRPTRSSWHDALMYLALPTWLLGLWFSLGWSPRARAERVGNDFVVRFTSGWRYGLPTFLIVPFTAFELAMLPKAPAEPAAASVMLLFYVVTVAVTLLLPRERFHVSSSGVDRISPWSSRVTSLRWAEITSVELVDRSRSFAMTGPSGTRLKVPLVLEGSGDFAARALASLPAPVLGAGTNVRTTLEAVAARVAWESRAPDTAEASSRGAVVTSGEWWPMVSAVLLVSVGTALWSYSSKYETPLRFPVPSGWVDLSPGVPDRNFEGFPPKTREQARSHNVIAFAAEPPTDVSSGPDQGFMVRIQNGVLNVETANQKLFGVESGDLVPNARVVSHGIETIGGVRMVRAELTSTDGNVIVYLAPVIARTAIALFSCAQAECRRVREIATAVMSSAQGIAEPGFRSRYVGPLIRSIAMLALFAAIYAGIVGAQSLVRRRSVAALRSLPSAPCSGS